MGTLKSWVAGRSVAEILILLVGVTVCGYVVFSTTVIVIVAIISPDVELADAARNIADIINTLIGLLAGFLAGRTELSNKLSKGEEPREDAGE